MSRYSEVKELSAVEPVSTQVPLINRAHIGQLAPVPLTVPHRSSTDPLPLACS